MNSNNFNTLSEAVNALTDRGFIEDFKAEDNYIIALNQKRKYLPEEMVIVESYHFDGLDNSDDDTELFAIKTIDDLKGTLVMSYSAAHSQNVELVKRIKKQNKN